MAAAVGSRPWAASSARTRPAAAANRLGVPPHTFQPSARPAASLIAAGVAPATQTGVLPPGQGVDRLRQPGQPIPPEQLPIRHRGGSGTGAFR